MSWGEIKKAINSTIGTAGFQPLDAIIKGQKTFVASDNTMIVLSAQSDKTWNDGTIIGTFTPKTSGSVRLMAEIGNDINDRDAGIIVQRDGVTLTSFYADSGVMRVMSADFQVDENAQYTFIIAVSGTGYQARTNYIRICADIVDGSLFAYSI